MTLLLLPDHHPVIIIIILESAVQGRERVRTLYQSKDPNPTQPTHGRKKKINSWRQKKSRSCQQESIGSSLETRQSHTIKHRVTKIIPKRHREGYKASAHTAKAMHRLENALGYS